MEHAPLGRVQLGEFVLNVKTGELYPAETHQHGRKVLLQEQPFQVLEMLIERRGEIVTRQEIRSQLWPNDTVVDFDHGINGAIATLRRVLGDSADEPRYIETIARRGYRLLAPTNWLGAPSQSQDGEHRDRVQAAQAQPGNLIGKKVSHYRVLAVIGGGGMGMVYKAEDIKLGRSVALKFLPEELANDPLALQRFEREAQTASALNHPNICTIYEIEEYEGQPFIVMELLEGDSLLHHLAASDSKAISLAPLLDIAIQICNGLQAAHDKSIIHRDIKPANLFLTQRGPVKILDFGLAKLVASEELVANNPGEARGTSSRSSQQVARESDARGPAAVHAILTRTGPAMGTSGYMSPEQVRKEKLDARTDLFSFGVVLYEMATGQRPFRGDTTALVHDAILNQTPVPAHHLNSAVPPGLDAIVAKAMEKDRTGRYQSAGEMRTDFERIRKEMQPADGRTRKWFGAGVLLVVLALATWISWRLSSRVTLSPSETIVIAVSNQSGDPVFNDALYVSLGIGLEQTPYFNVLAATKVGAALSALHLSADPTKMTPQIAREVCLRTNSKMVIASSIAEAGNDLRIGLEGIECQSGKTIARVRQDALSRTQVVHVLGLSATELRAKLGEPAASVARFNKPLEEATSASPEALQLLSEGYKRHLSGDLRGAISDYQRAIEVDPGLAAALTSLAGAHKQLGEDALAAAAATRAYELRARLTDPVRFQAESLYYIHVTGELEKGCAVLSEWVQRFPEDFIAHNNFGKCLESLGQLDRSLAEAREAARLYPSPLSYNAVILRSILTDRLDEAKATYARADARKFDGPYLRENRALLAFLQHDKPTMQEQWRWAVGKPGVDHVLLYGRALTEAYYGHYRDYRRLSAQATDLAAKANALLAVDDDDALYQAEVGNLTQARQIAEKAGKRFQNHQITPPNSMRFGHSQSGLALAFARAGDTAQAQHLADSMNQDGPLDTLIQNYFLPTIRAAMKLHTNDPAAALEILRATVSYDLANPDSPDCFSSLYPAYIRGLAYLQLGDGRLAGAEFQKLIDHPGVIGRNVIGALARLQIARAQRLVGDKAAARKSYEDFLTLWKDADPGLPVYRQAKAEYAKLGQE